MCMCVGKANQILSLIFPFMALSWESFQPISSDSNSLHHKQGGGHVKKIYSFKRQIHTHVLSHPPWALATIQCSQRLYCRIMVGPSCFHGGTVGWCLLCLTVRNWGIKFKVGSALRPTAQAGKGSKLQHNCLKISISRVVWFTYICTWKLYVSTSVVLSWVITLLQISVKPNLMNRALRLKPHLLRFLASHAAWPSLFSAAYH